MGTRSCSCRVIALTLALLGSLAGARFTGQPDEAPAVDYAGIEDVDRPYTLDKLIKGGVFNYDEDATTAMDLEDTTLELCTENLRFDQSDEGEQFEAQNDAPTFKGKILGVTQATPGQFPFYTLVKSVHKGAGRVSHCGGVLVSDSWVITAAQAATVEVSAGVISPEKSSAVSPAEVKIHPGYRSNFLIHDIALLKLETPFKVDSLIAPITLPSNGKAASLDNQMVRTIGFGSSDNSSSLGSTLSFVDLQQISKAKCNAKTEPIYVIYPGNSGCLSSNNAARGFCYGDTGGPVIYTYSGDSAPTLVGINSQHQGCPSEYPMAYTKIEPYLPWIQDFVTL